MPYASADAGPAQRLIGAATTKAAIRKEKRINASTISYTNEWRDAAPQNFVRFRGNSGQIGIWKDRREAVFLFGYWLMSAIGT